MSQGRHEEDDDFQEPVHIDKKQRVDPGSPSEESEDDIDANCSLCNEPWANNGQHQIVSLKCGDTFGKSCIMQVLTKAKKLHGSKACVPCPECGEPVKKPDLWPYYSKKSIPDDSAQLEAYRKQVEMKENILREQQACLADLIKEQRLLRLSLAQLSEVRPTTESPCTGISPSPCNSQPVLRPIYQLVGTKELAGLEQKVSRVMAFDPLQETVVISMGSLSKGHGINRISLHDLDTMEFIPNHTDQVRDVRCAANGMLLSTGLDRTLKLTSSSSKCVLQTYPLEAAGWSCDFDVTNPNILHCGLATDTILVFDIRNTREHLNRLATDATKGSPVNSLTSCVLEGEPALLCANLKRSYVWRSADQTPTTADCTLLEVEEGCQPMSVSYDTVSNTILVATRKRPSTKFVVGQFVQNTFQSCWSFEPSYFPSSLIRTFHFARAGEEDKPIVCFSDAKGLMHLRSRSGVEETLSVQNRPVLDIKGGNIRGDQLLVALTPNSLQTFRHSANQR